MREEKNSVLLIGSTLNYMTNSIVTQLEAFEINVLFSEAKVDSISKLGKAFSAIVMFLDDRLIDEQTLLVYVKDLATEEGMPIFLLGYDEEIKNTKEIIPSHLIAQEFERPVNVTEMAKSLNGYFDTHSVGNKKKILVVDDSGSALRMIKGWFEEKYQVILASSGMMAIKYLTQDNPELVLLDYEMPVCDGKQVLEMIRSESDYSNVPVIFLTSKGDRDSIMKVMSLKPDGYLLKTMPPEDIVKAIDEFFEKRKGKI